VPTLFHGTGLKDAQPMAGHPGQINVARGGGEFGRGFYTQYAEYHALAWAIRVSSRLNGPPCVLRLDIDETVYARLSVHYLDAVTSPSLAVWLDQTGQKRSYFEGTHDVLEGPILGNMNRLQQKFESAIAEQILNSKATTRTVI
jgi:hypothetical protein